MMSYVKVRHQEIMIDESKWTDGVPEDEGMFLVVWQDPVKGAYYLMGAAIMVKGPRGGKKDPYWLDGSHDKRPRFKPDDGEYFWRRIHYNGELYE